MTSIFRGRWPLIAAVFLVCLIAGGLMGMLTERQAWGATAAAWAQAFGTVAALAVALWVPDLARATQRSDARTDIRSHLQLIEFAIQDTYNLTGPNHPDITPGWLIGRSEMLGLLIEDLRTAAGRASGESNLRVAVITGVGVAIECRNMFAKAIAAIPGRVAPPEVVSDTHDALATYANLSTKALAMFDAAVALERAERVTLEADATSEVSGKQ